MTDIGRRLIIHEGERVEVERFDVPEPGLGQALVKIHRTQVSGGTEIVKLKGEAILEHKRRRRFGYTAVGHVISVGPEMDRLNPGDRVLTMCNHSTHCLTGKASDSGDPESVQYVTSEQSKVYPIDVDITDEQAVFAGPLGGVALQGVRRAELQIGESVAVVGQGVVGQMVTAYCRLSGAYPVIAIDLDDKRLALSKISGATHTINSSKQDPVEEIRKLTGNGAESVFFVTRVPGPIVDCINAAAPSGKVIIVGLAPGDVQIELVTPMLRELDIRAVYDGGTDEEPHPYMPWVPSRNYNTIMGMIARGDLKVDHLISHVAKPEDANELYQKMLSGPTGWMSVLFDWDD